MDASAVTRSLSGAAPDLKPVRAAAPEQAGQTFQEALAQSSSGSPDTLKIPGAARQFEALLIGQILKTARQSSDGWLGTGDDHAGELALELAEQQFAQAMSAQGGLGFAKLVIAGLDRGSAKASSSGSPAAPRTPLKSTDSTP